MLTLPRSLSSLALLIAVIATACNNPSAPEIPDDPMPAPMAPNTPPVNPETPPPAPAPPPPPQPETARYRLTFQARWSPATHPDDIPGSAHFSRLVGGNHNASVTFWQAGATASQGIREMAELGRANPLDREIQDAIAAGTAETLTIGPAADKSPDTVSMDITLSQRFPLFTLVTMIAPSPDWFVGVAGLPLFENGQWVDERRVELDPYDAGTDSGGTFFAPNQATVPQVPIFRITTWPLSPGGRVTPLGSFTFTRLP